MSSSWSRRRGGWGGPEDERGYISRVAYSVIRTIIDVVPGGVIRAGKSSYTDTSTGWWLGVDSDALAKFNIGSSTYYLRWTGTRLEIAGSLTTKNGYVQIIDESAEDYGEGITLLMAAWLASGALRWKSSAAKIGAYLTTNNSGTASTDVLLNAYPRVTGAGNASAITLAAYNKAAGEAGATVNTLALNSAGELTTTAKTTVGGAADVVQLIVSGCEGGQTAALVQAKDASATTVFAVDAAGNVQVAGEQVLTVQQNAIADMYETGSATDQDARARINQILDILRAHGLIIPDVQLHDLFSTDRAAGAVNSTAAEPGPGTRTITDVEGTLTIANDRLRGGGQPTSAVWGDAKCVWPAITRQTGRTLLAMIWPQDKSSDIAFGWASSASIGDPSADGHGWLNTVGKHQLITPGATPVLASGEASIRPSCYLIGIVLADAGASVFISSFDEDDGLGMVGPLSIPQYPTARWLYVGRSGTTNPLYPYTSYLDSLSDIATYSLHAIEDVRVIDVTDWAANDAPATFADRCTRANSVSAIGNDWVSDTDTWGISSNAIYAEGGTNLSHAYHAAALSDGIYYWEVTPPAATTWWGLTFRRTGANSYLRLTNNGTSNELHLQRIVNGAYDAEITAGGGVTWAGATTYRICCIAKSNQYLILINDVAWNSIWITDGNSYNLTGAGIGVASLAYGASSARFDNIATYPHTFTLPSQLQSGAVPLVLTAGSTIASDDFNDTNGTDLDAHTADSGGAWTEHIGTWTIQSNKASVSLSAMQNGMATQNLAVADCEMQVEITVPASWNANEFLFAGITARYIDSSNWCAARIVTALSVHGNDEIEIIESIGGISYTKHKVQFAITYYELAHTYTLKVQVHGDTLLVWLDGHPCEAMLMDPALRDATRHGLFRHYDDSGCVFDNWSVKTL